jgi:hypothetical protein
MGVCKGLPPTAAASPLWGTGTRGAVKVLMKWLGGGKGTTPPPARAGVAPAPEREEHTDHSDAL